MYEVYAIAMGNENEADRGGQPSKAQYCESLRPLFTVWESQSRELEALRASAAEYE